MPLNLPTPPLGVDAAKQGDDYLRALDTALKTQVRRGDLAGPFADRPSASTAGERYYCTDTGWELRANGTSWDLINGVAIGDLVDTLRTSDPPGGYYLLADGRDPLPRASYPALGLVVGGTGPIPVPDLKGAGRVAPSNMGTTGARTGNDTVQATTLLQRIGEAGHKLTIPELAAHVHDVVDPGHGHVFGRRSGGNGSGVPGYQLNAGGDFGNPDVTASSATGITVAPKGGDGFHNTVHPSVVMNVLIRVR